jgi:hypothetical protein
MSKCTVGHDPVRKRYCRVTQDLKIGEVVLSEYPFECVLYDNESASWCHDSFRNSSEGQLLRYGQCLSVQIVALSN